MKVAIVYDRVNKWGGAERVLLTLHELFPKAPLYTAVYDKKGAPWAKVFPKIETSILQNVPLAKSNHEFFPHLMPVIFESFDFSNFDLVVSVTSEAAKGIKTGKNTLHVCYCLTPTRYLWSHKEEYFKNPIFKLISKPLVNLLRVWDKNASKKPDKIIAISSEVKKRVKKYYGIDSEVVFPPVNVSVRRYVRAERKYYLVVSRLVGYKRTDLAVEAFNKLGYPLVIVGVGSEMSMLKKLAKKNIKFAGLIPERKLVEFYKGAKALIMPQEEDFGIVSVEAQSFGTPVIAYSRGGVKDTVVPGKTGILFDKQNVENLVAAVKKFEKSRFVSNNLLRNAKRFSKENFKRQFKRSLIRAGFGGWRGHSTLAKIERRKS